MNPLLSKAMGMFKARKGGSPMGANDHDGDEPSAARTGGGNMMARLRGRVRKVKPDGGTAQPMKRPPFGR